MTKITAAERYETDSMFAQYLEAEWGDLAGYADGLQDTEEIGLFEFGTRTLQFYRAVADAVATIAIKDARYLDIGGALGRLCFELAHRRSDLRIHHYDKSKRFSGFLGVLTASDNHVQLSPKDAAFFARMPEGLSVTSLRLAVEKARLIVLDQEPESQQQFDFVSCCNVFDRVKDQPEFISRLSGLVGIGGHVLLTTPYDFERTAEGPHFTVEELIPTSFTLIHEQDIDYIQRVNPRKLVSYKAQMLIFRRAG